MRTTTRLAVLGGLSLTATALFAGAATAATPHSAGHPAGHASRHAARPVFVQTDNPAGNAVVAYGRSSDGTLHRLQSYATGGVGGVLDGSVVDHTASEGSLAYDARARQLYAVNAGSNTITVFGVHGNHLAREQVLPSGGTFPVSIAAHGNAVYVLNARDGGSVQGYLRLGHDLVRVPAWHRSLGLDPTATPEFTNTPGQVAFTPDGSKLIVTTKANGNNFDVFPVNFTGGIAARPVVTNDADGVPFGLTFDAQGQVVVAEAGPNAVATFAFNRDDTLRLVARTATGQAATCWVVRAGDTFYLSNAGSGNLSAFAGSDTLKAIGTTVTDRGTVDATVTPDGHFLYVQTGATGTVDEFRITAGGGLTRVGSVVVPGAVGGEGIAAV
jgi:DNA-binding beta-propeller fold protein YncE